MSRLALYQKYRSQTFDEVVGQEYIVRSIRNAVKENKVGHAYLFCGPRGTGKTTMARLLARAVNCEHPESAPCGECTNCRESLEGTHPDIIEINAANETHVEDIRDLIERAQLAPMLGKHKVYIIDEVHQLSTSASSALLKTLEEPPEHVIFILATTDPQKLLNTIISRCQRYDFSKVDTKQIAEHLLNIAGKEGFALDEKAAYKIAELADGGMRDALSILDQANSYASDNITEESIDEIFGLASSSEKLEFLNDIFEQNLEGILVRITNAVDHGIDIRRLTSDLSVAIKDGVIYQYTRKASLLHALTEEQAKMIADKMPAKKLLDIVKIFMDAEERYKTAQSTVTVFEVACMDAMAVNETFTIPQETAAAAPVRQKTPAVVQETVIAPTVFTPTPAEEKPVEVKKAVSAQFVEVNTENIVRILVQCNKACKSKDEEIVQNLLSNSEMNKYLAVLKQSTIGGSGEDCILLVTKSDFTANNINETVFNRELYFYLKEHGMDKMPFAASKNAFDGAVNEFRACMQRKQLPEKLPIERYAEEKTEEMKEPSAEEKVLKFFGAENVEIIDE